jgi:hypothetical protein
MRRSIGFTAAAALLAAVVVGVLSPVSSPASAEVTAKWDKVANIKEMAAHIGNVQRSQGIQRAMTFLDACYRTHGLGSTYSKAFEGCIVADFLISNALVAVIARVPEEELRKTGVAMPSEVLKAMGARIGSGLSQYNVAAADVSALKDLIDRHGTGLFLKTVFPEAVAIEQDAAKAPKRQ